MKHANLRRLIFLALCCDLGLFTKRLIAPAVNILTDALHIPGGIGTSFSLLFLVVAAILMPGYGWGILMATIQSALALSLGMVGSMGLLSPIGYLVPGLVIDCVVFLSRRLRWEESITAVLANMLAAASASLTANAIVFQLWGFALALYVAVALSSGAVCGLLASTLAVRLRPVLDMKRQTKREEHFYENKKDDPNPAGCAALPDGGACGRAQHHEG